MQNPKLHILLVDDDEDDRMFFEEALEDMDLGIDFEHAANGIEALQRLTEKGRKLPDIIFLDLNMSLLSGRDCLERIRSHKFLDNLKVVIYSTSFDPGTVGILHKMGANHYIRKPGAYNELKRSIFTAIKSLVPDMEGEAVEPGFVINP